MKALKPSHREHKRYLLISGKDTTKENIEEAILKFVGILGFAEASPMIIKSSEKEGRIILSINRVSLEKVRASLMLSGRDMRVVRVSGMVNRL